jgi:hypothetical protein
MREALTIAKFEPDVYEIVDRVPWSGVAGVV